MMNTTDKPELYLQINYCLRASGFEHQFSNLSQRYLLARSLNATLVLSPVYLKGRPPFSRRYETTLAEFVDYASVTCCGEPMKVVECLPPDIPTCELKMTTETSLEQIETAANDFKTGARGVILNIEERAPGNLLHSLPLFHEVEQRNKRNYPSTGTSGYPPADKPRRIAECVIERIGRPYTCIHVRRGDRLSENETYTTCSAIKKGIEFVGIPNVYLMSDESVEYFDPLLDSNFKILRYPDFSELRELADPQVHGGHMLFMVERNLMKRADRRILTRGNPHFAHDYALIPPHIPPDPHPL